MCQQQQQGAHHDAVSDGQPLAAVGVPGQVVRGAAKAGARVLQQRHRPQLRRPAGCRLRRTLSHECYPVSDNLEPMALAKTM